VAARRLCVVSRNPLRSGVFIAGLPTSVGSQDQLEMIVDRRRGRSPGDQPSIERRQRSSVVRALERDGFAIVLMPSGPASERAGVNGPQAQDLSPTAS
jgi:hypothetical protein